MQQAPQKVWKSVDRCGFYDKIVLNTEFSVVKLLAREVIIFPQKFKTHCILSKVPEIGTKCYKPLTMVRNIQFKPQKLSELKHMIMGYLPCQCKIPIQN